MDEQINKEILEELRKQTQYTKRANIYGPIIALIVVGIIFIGGHYFPRNKQLAEPCKESHSWSDVSSSIDKCDYQKALSIAKILTEKTPNAYYGYAYLGNIYNALGDQKNAEINYAKAYELFPIKENKENLDAVRKILSKTKI